MYFLKYASKVMELMKLSPHPSAPCIMQLISFPSLFKCCLVQLLQTQHVKSQIKCVKY